MNGEGYFERSSLFDQMDDDEIKLIMGKFKKVTFQSGEYIFKENDSGDTLYIVEEGSVSLKKLIINDYEKTLFVAYSGFIFGEFSFIDGKERSASAVSGGNSVLLRLARSDFDDFIKENALTGAKLFSNLLNTITDRLRQTNELYRDAIRWGIEATGTQNLNFQHFITEKVTIRLELTNNRIIEGRILQLEQSEAGYELIIVDKTDDIAMIPYHAIVSVSVSQAEAAS
jgi:CRP-like cAMP-binding protein